MALAKVMCKCAACGNEFEFRKKLRNRKEADSFEAWAVENITECFDCRQKRRQAEREQENLKAAAKAKEIGLPELKGSTKQIDWAESIRMKARAAIDSDLTKMTEQEKSVVAPFVEWLFNHEKAAFWIDRRDDFTPVKSTIINEWKRETNRKI